MKRNLSTLAITLFLIQGVCFAQKNAPLTVDIDPENERKSFILPEGFEVNLFAGDPQLAKPIQICFDTKGRLWAACSSTYPQVLPGQPNQDKILVMEDTDGDGIADKTTVFADGLLIPTGLAPGDGGVYVIDSTDLIHLSDTDGDGKADTRKVILSGFGTEDTHHMVHTLRWGMDGLLYFNQSIYIHSHLETPYGPKRLGGGGIWQLRPKNLELEITMRGLVNSWGHHFDQWGQSFATDGAGGEGINYVIPRAYYATAVGAKRVVQGLNPGSPKHCGLEILSGRHLPEDWQQSFITNDFRGHRVCRFTLEPDGAGYISKQQPELIKTNHPAFRPIDVRQGPDGAIYIADWFNPIIQHGEVDFRDPRRDKTHGRIWRVTAKNRPLVPRPKLEADTNAALFNHMKDPEMWTRHMARRVLVERKLESVTPDLKTWTNSIPADDEVLNLEALWTWQALDLPNEKLLGMALAAKNPNVRAAGIRVAEMWRNKMPGTFDLVKAKVNDSHPQVRLEAVRALGLYPKAEAAEASLAVLDSPMDKFIEYSLWLTLQELQDSWLPAFSKGELTFGGKSDRMVYALKAAGTADVAKKLGELVVEGKLPPSAMEGAYLHLASVGGPVELGIVATKALGMADAQAGNAILSALIESTKTRAIKAQIDPKVLMASLESKSDPRQASAIRLLGLWKIISAQSALEGIAKDDAKDLSIRKAAFESIADLGSKSSIALLKGMIAASSDNPLPIKRWALVSLASLDVNSAAELSVKILELPQSSAELAEVFDAFLSKKEGLAPILKVLANSTISADAAKVGIRQAKGSGRDVTELIKNLEKAGKIGAVSREISKEKLAEMAKAVLAQGDPARGELVFRRKELVCMKCHAISGSGGLVGPDMTSIGASAQIDYLIESMINPNKAIKENYHSIVVTTDDGKVFNGIKVRQDNNELVLRDAEDRLINISLKKIEEQKNGKSLMPEGMVDSLTQGELLDLVRFLSELGKVGPYGPGKASIVRRYEAMEPDANAYTVLGRKGQDAFANPAENLKWSNAYAMVVGTLPLRDLPLLQQKRSLENITHSMAFVRFGFETSSMGSVNIMLDKATGISAWVDGKPMAITPTGLINLKVTPGVHTVVLKLDGKVAGVKVEVEDDKESPAKVKIVQGK
jgi:putative heme-binding domain-containing protein